MAKQLRQDAIVEQDLIEYVRDQSDFAFELRVLRLMHSLEFQCEHGGTYTDSVTNKPREFDLRCMKKFGDRIIRLAVECKHLQPNFPLLLSGVPRREEESFHEVVYSINRTRFSLTNEDLTLGFQKNAKTIRVIRGGMYRIGQPVGKAIDQVGRSTQSEFVAKDPGVFDKWSQALSSAQELVDLACYDGEERYGSCVSIVLPILVVPDDTLWQIDFTSTGTEVGNPRKVSRCAYAIRRSYEGGDRMCGIQYTVSHLEFVTQSGLRELIIELTGSDRSLDSIFPLGQVRASLEEGVRLPEWLWNVEPDPDNASA